MKAFRFMVLSFVLVFCLIISIGISKAGAFTYYGEFRWKIFDNGEEEDIFRLGVADMGGGHLILSGRSEDSGYPIHGSGEVIGSNVFLILHYAVLWGDGVEFEIGTMSVTLSLNSLDGTSHNMYACCGKNPDDIVPLTYESGTFKFLGQAK